MTHPWTRVRPEGVAGPAGGSPAPGTIRRWWPGARPRTLPAAVVPVLVGTAAALPRHPGTWSQVAAASLSGGVHGGPRVDPWWCAVGALLVALAVQIGTNYANDYADGIRGTDDVRVGPTRLVASGLATPGAVRRAALLAFGVAAVVGFGLAWATSWWVLPVGAACLLAGWFYTGGPRPYGYAGLGEVFVFVFFGLVATVGTFFVETVRINVPIVWFASVLVGLLATALLLANNLRDIATDRESGKRTLAVRIGRNGAGRCYAVCIVLPFAAVAVWGILAVAGALASDVAAGAFVPLLALPLVVVPLRLTRSDAEGRVLLPLLAATARLQLVFGILLSVALWLWIG